MLAQPRAISSCSLAGRDTTRVLRYCEFSILRAHSLVMAVFSSWRLVQLEEANWCFIHAQTFSMGSPHFNVSPLCLPAECCPCHGLSGTENRTVDAVSLIPVRQWIFVLGWWNFPRSFIREVSTPGKKIRVLGCPQMILFSKNYRPSFIAYTVEFAACK